MSVTASKTASRSLLELGSKDLTTASMSRGKLGYSTIGFLVMHKCHPTTDDLRLTLRIKNATICKIDLLYSVERGCRMSSDKVVMNRGLLLEAICSTAARACGPGLRTLIDSLREVVASVNRDRSAAIASKYDCHISNPREHMSIASVRYGEVSSYR